MHNNDVKSTFSQEVFFGQQFQELYEELCYQTFMCTDPGRKLLALLENKHFRSPTLHPGRDIGWGYINEGRNELIRSFSAAMQSYIVRNQKKLQPKRPRSKTSAKS